MKKQKTLKITGNLLGDLDRLTEAYANRGYYYGTHIASALERAAHDWRETLRIALEDLKNGHDYWNNGGKYITQFGHTEPNDYCRTTNETND